VTIRLMGPSTERLPMTLTTLPRINRIILRKPHSTRAKILRGEALTKFTNKHATTQLHWHAGYQCWYAEPSESIGTLMIFTA
jgi:hypothetical protein